MLHIYLKYTTYWLHIWSKYGYEGDLTTLSYILISWIYLHISTTYPGGPTCGHLFSCPPAEKHPFRSEHSVLDWVCGEGRAAAQVSWTMIARVKTVRSIQSFIVTGKRATFWSSSRGRVGLYGIRADYSYSETGLTPPTFYIFRCEASLLVGLSVHVCMFVVCC